MTYLLLRLHNKITHLRIPIGRLPLPGHSHLKHIPRRRRSTHQNLKPNQET
jgi:hypothetical protein